MKNTTAVPSTVRLCAVCLVLFFGTLLFFSRAVGHSFLDYDDPDYVVQNIHVHGGLTGAGLRWAFTSDAAGNWHPLTWLSHMVDWQLFGNNPHGHHAMNVFWHALNAVMAFLALRRLTGAFWTSAICAAMFAWHPLRVESVAWIAERKDVLSVFFGLLTLWAYAVHAQNEKENNGKTTFFYVVALAAFATGLMCKSMLVTLPCLLLLLDWWPLQRLNPARLIIEKIPFLLLSAGSCLMTYFAQKKGGAVVETLTLGDRLANAVVSVARYLEKFFWPFNLSVGYPQPPRWPALTVAGALILLLTITGAALWQRTRRPWLLVGWLWFLGMLVPVIGLVQVGLQAMANRYTYLPMLGVQLALLWTLREMILSAPLRRMAVVAITLLLAALAARTWNQLGVWQNSNTLYEHALAVDDNNYLAQCYLGSALLSENRAAEAEPHFRRALKLKPDYSAARHRLGLVLEKLGRPDEAQQAYMEVLKIRPDYAEAHYNLGLLLLDRNQPTDALAHFQAVLRIKPDFAPADVHYQIANALITLDHEPEALSHYESALQLNPDFEKARSNYANLLRKLGHPAEACAQFRRALALQPNDPYAHFGLGAALEDLGRPDEALASYNEAARIKPDYAVAQYNVGTMLLNRNQPAEAESHFQAAVKSQPDYDGAYVGLGLAAEQLGHAPEAMVDYQQALAVNPNNAQAHCCWGSALRRAGKYADAITHDEAALRLQPDFADAQAELGNALYRSGQIAEAIPHWEQALRLNPDFPGISDWLARARRELAK